MGRRNAELDDWAKYPKVKNGAQQAEAGKQQYNQPCDATVE
jgi:hypothetical protein